jgi:hypothetical protein
LKEDNDTMVAVTAPAWKWEWNLNTVVILLGFLAGIAAWGGTWQKLTDTAGRNASSIDRLDSRLTALEMAGRRLDNHELRLAIVEKQATDAAGAMRAVESTLGVLTTDVKVVREILQRLEAAQNDRRTR